ncbi:MAG: TVP38/TMEM64 family protein [Amphiplicatus sp.]
MQRNKSAARFLPLLLLLILAGVVFATGAHRYVSLEALRAHYAELGAFVDGHYVAALSLFMLVYMASTALSIPGATILSLLGGFLFGIFVGTAAVVVAATAGATLIFLAARTAFGDFFKNRAAGFLKKMKAGFESNAFSYLLLLRLIPLFPFFIVNIVPAFTRIRTATYILATLLGIIPGAFAYVSAGNGLGAVFKHGEELDLRGLLLQPEIVTPIVALSVLALLPLLYKRLRGRASS